MKARKPGFRDLQHMSQAIALLSAYNWGIECDDFTDFARLSSELTLKGEQREAFYASIQLAWMLLNSLESQGRASKSEVLQWYGRKFAEKAEELRSGNVNEPRREK